MMVCFELGKSEAELQAEGWTIEDIMRWIAFLRLKNKAEAKAIERAQQEANRGGGGGSKGKTTVTKY